MGPGAHRLRRARLSLRRTGLRRADQRTGGHKAHHRRPPRRHRRGRGPQAGCPRHRPCARRRGHCRTPRPETCRPHHRRPRQALPARARRGPLQALDRSPVPPCHRAPYRPRPRHAACLRHRQARRRRPPAFAPRPPGHGQPGGGDAVPHDRPGPGLGRRCRGGEPLPLGPEVQGGPARALPHRCRVPPLRHKHSTSWRERGASRPMRRRRSACSCSPAAGGTRS